MIVGTLGRPYPEHDWVELRVDAAQETSKLGLLLEHDPAA